MQKFHGNQNLVAGLDVVKQNDRSVLRHRHASALK